MNNQGSVYISNEEHKGQTGSGQSETDIERNREKLDDLVDKSRNNLFSAKAFFPLDPFPDEITIDTNKVLVVRNSLFTRNEFPIPSEKITNIEVHFGLLLASIRIEVRGYSQDPHSVSAFRKSDARTIKQFITALIRVHEKNIDLSEMKIGEIKDKLLSIGKADASKEGVNIKT